MMPAMQTPVYLLPVGALLISVVACLAPELLIHLKPAIPPLLGLVMLGMGMTLRPHSFLAIFKRPAVIAVGLLMQYGLMPLTAWLLSMLLELPLAIGIGLVLVGTCPGGTASNVICYLARADVALSITLTTVSTLCAVVLTPLLAWAYIGQQVPVPIVAMIVDVLLIIVLPVVAGLVLRHWLGHGLQRVERVFPYVSMLAIVLIIGIIVALNQAQLENLATATAIAVIIHNALGLAGGYSLARLLGYDAKAAQTLAIEVGMQNSGLGVALALKYFSALSALPGALFSVWHNVTGALLAAWWGRSAPATVEQQDNQSA